MTNENTALAIVSEEDAKAYFSESRSKKGSGIPRLRINSSAEDADGNIITDAAGKPLGAGTFFVDGVDIYQKEILFVPVFQYSQYTKLTKEFKLECQTVYMDGWDTEPLDSNGGLRCGRPSSQALAQLPADEQAEWKKNVPASLHVFGLAFFDEGPKEGIPVDFRVSGGKFAVVSEALKSVKEYRRYFFKLSLKRMTTSNGGNTYFELAMEKTKDKVQVTPFLIDTANLFNTYVEEANARIIESHKEAVSEEALNETTKDFMDNIINSTEYTEVEPELNDEVPFA